ncbi:MAG: IPT/TIG domain-containing protein [Ignavibacteria bacterium]|nr:IPT/TIG domain-containing protein [Ignavibacteria bacterium]
MRLTRLLFFALLCCASFASLQAQSTTTATVLRPYITSISPQSLLAGVDSTVLTINGKRFQRGAAVYFNARKLTNVRIDGDSVIVAVVPAELTVNADVAVLLVENPDETKIGTRLSVRPEPCSPFGVASGGFGEIRPTSTFASTQPFTVQVLGTSFAGNIRAVLGGVELLVYSTSATSVMARVPAFFSSGQHLLQVIQREGCVLGKLMFIYPHDPIFAPAITRVNPIFFPPNGGNITITGVNFSTLATVRLGSTTLAIVSISETRIVAIVPPVGYSLFTTLSVTNPDGQVDTQTLGYIVDPNNLAPAITEISPPYLSANGGVLTITGADFSTQAIVRLGSSILTTISISANRIVAIAPPNLEYGRNSFVVSVTNPDGWYVSRIWGISVSVNISESQVHISPNPATTALTLETTLDRAATLTLTLRNILGEAVLQEHHTAASGRFATTLDVSALANGVYMLEVSDGTGGRWVQKVVKY